MDYGTVFYGILKPSYFPSVYILERNPRMEAHPEDALGPGGEKIQY
jgi:hypothetical protein